MGGRGEVEGQEFAGLRTGRRRGSAHVPFRRQQKNPQRFDVAIPDERPWKLAAG